MTIVTITKAPTWTEKITGLEMHEVMHAPYESMRTITSLISGLLRIKYPDMYFETFKDEVEVKGKATQTLAIKRITEEEYLLKKTKKQTA